jgi:hypothetical protein
MRKHNILLTCVAVLILGMGLSLQAQNVDGIKANIPFSFVAGHKVMPAGVYTVTRLNHNSPDVARVVRSLDGRNVAVVLGGAFGKSAQGKPVLVFHRYGGTYVLSGARSTSVSMVFYSSTEAKILSRQKANSGSIIAAN